MWLTLCFENNIKILKIQADRDEEELENSYEYLIKIPQIGISVIGNYGPVRKEIIHLLFEDIKVDFSGNADYNDVNLVVSKCRIEN